MKRSGKKVAFSSRSLAVFSVVVSIAGACVCVSRLVSRINVLVLFNSCRSLVSRLTHGATRQKAAQIRCEEGESFGKQNTNSLFFSFCLQEEWLSIQFSTSVVANAIRGSENMTSQIASHVKTLKLRRREERRAGTAVVCCSIWDVRRRLSVRLMHHRVDRRNGATTRSLTDTSFRKIFSACALFWPASESTASEGRRGKKTRHAS